MCEAAANGAMVKVDVFVAPAVGLSGLFCAFHLHVFWRIVAPKCSVAMANRTVTAGDRFWFFVHCDLNIFAMTGEMRHWDFSFFVFITTILRVVRRERGPQQNITIQRQ